MTATTTALRFPSIEWFEALQGVFNQEIELHRSAGQADTSMAVRVGDDIIKLTFAVYSLTKVERISEEQLNEVDFYLDQPLEAWQAMLANIKEHGRAEGKFTLNSLDGEDPEGLARSKAGYLDGDARDAFYRFNQTFQNLFDLSARLETTY